MALDSDPVRAEYARLSHRYDRRWPFYIDATIRATMRRFAVQPGDHVLDVGCGTGSLLQVLARTFPQVELTGIDPSAEMLHVAQEKLRQTAKLQQGSAEQLPFADASFDTVVSTSAFHYFRRPAQALAEMKRVLRSKGQLVITDWCHDYLTCQLCDFFLRHSNRAHFRAYRTSECQRMLQEAGFEVITVQRYKINWLWGLMTANVVKGGSD